MKKNIILALAVLFLLNFHHTALTQNKQPFRFKPTAGNAQGRFAGNGIVVGLEYAVLHNKKIIQSMAKVYGETGMPGMKHFPDAVAWGKMQKGPNQAINFNILDMFVREYQKNGFTELTLCLKPHSHWGSKHVPKLGKHTNASPKTQYKNLFEKWIYSVVERYDGDGNSDMPGLRWPVRYIEIGSEFSSYQPEPVKDYLETLKIAYTAAIEHLRML